MSEMTLTLPEAARREATPDVFRLYLLESGYEFLRVLRTPAFALPTLLFPAMFYVFFGLIFNQGSQASTYLLATYGAFGVISPALFGCGVSLATERGLGWLTLKRATPMPPLAYVVAKLVMSLVFASLVVVILFTLGAVFGGVVLPRATWIAMAVTLVLGTLPFCAIGLALGAHLGPSSAPAVVNALYLPMSFLSGLWLPIQMFPKWGRTVASFLPPYHLGQLALRPLGMSLGQSPLLHIAVLLGVTVVGVAVAARGLARVTE